MFLKRHLNAFKIYIILLVICSSVLISGIPEFPLINFAIYLFIHILLIYLGIYYFNITLYFVNFITGIIFDIFLLNEIGTHTVTFMVLIIFLKQIKKMIISFSSTKIFIFIFIILFLSLICEMLISLLLFNINFEISNLIKSVLISLLIAYPIFYLFYKIDRFG